MNHRKLDKEGVGKMGTIGRCRFECVVAAKSPRDLKAKLGSL